MTDIGILTFKQFLTDKNAIFSHVSPDNLESILVPKLNSIIGSNCLKWYLDYGCVLLAFKQDGNDSSPEILLDLIYLDKWDCQMSSLVYQDRDLVQVSTDKRSYDCGTIPGDLIDEFYGLLSESEKKAMKGSHGQFKTHSLMYSVVCNALRALQIGDKLADQYRGGDCDAGQHIGTKTRGVEWGLIQAVIQKLVCDYFPGHYSIARDDALGEMIIINYYLWMLDPIQFNTLPDFVSFDFPISTARVNSLMEIIKTVALKCTNLAEKGYIILDFEERCRKARNLLDSIVSDGSKYRAQMFNLKKIRSPFWKDIDPDKFSGKEWQDRIEWRNPSILIPAVSLSLEVLSNDLTMARIRAQINLDAYLFILIETANIDEISSWLGELQSTKSGSQSEVQQMIMNVVEGWLFNTLKKITISRTPQWIKLLCCLLSKYRLVFANFSSYTEMEAHMIAELRSREVLSVWVVFVIVHAAASIVHPILNKYDVPLEWNSLRHLVLSDKAAVEAALCVASYLKDHSSHGKAIFNLTSQRETFNLAIRFGRDDRFIQEAWKNEQIEAARKENSRWVEIKRKQIEAVRLRIEVFELEADIVVLRRSKQQVEDEREDSKVYDKKSKTSIYPTSLYDRQLKSDIEKYDEKIQSKEKSLVQTKKHLQVAETPPPSIKQPLPRGEQKAMEVLFFLEMPIALRSLSTISIIAQQILLPRFHNFAKDTTGKN